ncbi:MAG: glycine cleavage system protein H [Nitrososphaerota archaeon]
MIEVDGYKILENLLYSKDHTWAKIEGDKAKVGITDYGQKSAGKIMFVRFRPRGTISQSQGIGTIETAKWVGVVKSPVSGEIIEINPKLRDNPSLINESPYEDGWVAIIKLSKFEEDKKNLMTAEEAAKWLKEEISKIKK